MYTAIVNEPIIHDIDSFPIDINEWIIILFFVDCKLNVNCSNRSSSKTHESSIFGLVFYRNILIKITIFNTTIFFMNMLKMSPLKKNIIFLKPPNPSIKYLKIS